MGSPLLIKELKGGKIQGKSSLLERVQIPKTEEGIQHLETSDSKGAMF